MTSTAARAEAGAEQGTPVAPAVLLESVVRTFGAQRALDGVSLQVDVGEIHALLGPNGAGKTTLVRTLMGLVDPTSGRVEVLGRATSGLGPLAARRDISFVPSGDRSFYLRLSGPENLLFFGRLQGLPARAVRQRVKECMLAVGLEDTGRKPVSAYSHGMQKRLSVARALITRPKVLLVDEATHDLDPEAAAQVRELVRRLADGGTAVIWATQRLDEIRGFADRVTVLRAGQVRFSGTVPQLQANALSHRFVVHVTGHAAHRAEARPTDLTSTARVALSGIAVVEALRGDADEHLVLGLREGHTLGEAITGLTRAGLVVNACREERSELEAAFLVLTRDD